ncbi:MAG: cation diffusion facilitator family transporter [Pseudomonadales bacterium]
MTHGDLSAGNSRERSLAIALGFCLMDVVLIGGAAFLSNSLSILGDLVKELGDTTAVLAALLTLRAVRGGPTHRFAYGIGKLENLVSISIGVLMLLAAIGIAFGAMTRFSEPEVLAGAEFGLLVFAVYAAIGYTIAARQFRELRKEYSPIMASQAQLWMSKATFDALMATALGLALLFPDQTFSLYLDPCAALIGVAFMLHSAYAIAAASVGDLLDAALEESLQFEILRCLALHFDDYDELYRIRTRRSGSRIYVELALGYAPERPMALVSDHTERIRLALVEVLPGADITISAAALSHAQSIGVVGARVKVA